MRLWLSSVRHWCCCGARRLAIRRRPPLTTSSTVPKYLGELGSQSRRPRYLLRPFPGTLVGGRRSLLACLIASLTRNLGTRDCQRQQPGFSPSGITTKTESVGWSQIPYHRTTNVSISPSWLTNPFILDVSDSTSSSTSSKTHPAASKDGLHSRDDCHRHPGPGRSCCRGLGSVRSMARPEIRRTFSSPSCRSIENHGNRCF